MPNDSSRRSVAGTHTDWIVPSDRMVIRRYKPLEYFADTLENGFRAGQADGYEAREGQVSPPARARERYQSNQTESLMLNNGEEMDLAEGVEQAREEGRQNYYANCWRLGTDEDSEIWGQYADLRDGVAIETTFGQLEQHVAPDDDHYMGIVRYLDYEEEHTPTGMFYSLYFFKHREFDSEQEFRILTNQGGNPIIRTDGMGRPSEYDPSNPEAVTLSADMDALINRVILAPDADAAIRAQVESTLEEYGVSAPVVSSRLSDPAVHTETYDAELGGAANYEASTEYLESVLNQFVEATDWETWNTVDVVQLNQEGVIHPRTTFVECYRYIEEPPDRSTYGQDHLDYEVRAHRIEDGTLVDTVLNDAATKTEAESE